MVMCDELDILIFGAGGHASKMINIAKASGMNVLGYISTEPKGTVKNGVSVIGDINYYKSSKNLNKVKIHVAIGENSVRYKIIKSIGVLKKKLVTLKSNLSFIANNVILHNGSSILQNTVIQTGVTIGECCIIDTGAIIEHDCKIGSFVNIAPGAILCGDVKINDGVIIGSGSVIIEKVTIGKNSLIGAGSVVINDIEANCIAVGSPARVIKKRNFTDGYIRR